MRISVVRSYPVLAAAALAALGLAPVAFAQKSAVRTNTARAWNAPRTPDGQPDLQGVWDFRSLTPLERPGEGVQAVLNEEEAATFQAQASERRNNHDSREGRGTDADVGRAYNEFWWDFGRKITTNRTSLVVNPADGRIPALTAQATARDAAAAMRRQRPAEGPEDRSLPERCITGFNAGPPMLPSAYNNNMQVVQTRDTVVILNEMIHAARVIPLDGRPHVSADVRQYAGDSRGHWEGSTLVVDTTHFKESGTGVFGLRGGGDGQMRLVERFTRTDANTLLYEFTVEDPTTYTAPWSAAVSMAKNDEQMFEYACHEGNYGMFGILSGARAQERAPSKKGSR